MKKLQTRRGFFAAAIGAAAWLLAAPTPARAALPDHWKVRWPNGHVDDVSGGTCQHKCESCHEQAFTGANVTVICPSGHSNEIDVGPCDDAHAVRSFKCRAC